MVYIMTHIWVLFYDIGHIGMSTGDLLQEKKNSEQGL